MKAQTVRRLKREMAGQQGGGFRRGFRTRAVGVVVLVDEDVVQDEAEQLGLQRGVGRVDQRLQHVAAPGDDLVAEDHQHVAEDGEGLRKPGSQSRSADTPTRRRGDQRPSPERDPGGPRFPYTPAL